MATAPMDVDGGAAETDGDRCPACSDVFSEQTGHYVLPCMHKMCYECVQSEVRDDGNHEPVGCQYLLEPGLSCGQRFDPANTSLLLLIKEQQDRQAQQSEDQDARVALLASIAAMQATLKNDRLAEIDVAVDGLAKAKAAVVARQKNGLGEVQQHYAAVLAAMERKYNGLDTATRARLEQECQAVQLEFKGQHDRLSADIKGLGDQRDTFLVMQAQYRGYCELTAAQLALLPYASLGTVLVNMQRLYDQYVLDDLVIAHSADVEYYAYPSEAQLPATAEAVACVAAVVQRCTIVNHMPSLKFSWHKRDYKAAREQPKYTFKPDGVIAAVAVDLGGNVVLSNSMQAKKEIVMLSPKMEVLRRIPTDTWYSMAIATSGDILNAYPRTRQIMVHDAATGMVRRRFDLTALSADQDASIYLAATPDGALVASLGSDKKVVKLDRDGKVAWVSSGAGFTGGCFGVAIIVDEVLPCVAVCDLRGNRIQILNLETGAHVANVGENAGSQNTMVCPSHVAYDAVAKYLVVVESRKTSVWHPKSGKLIASTPRPYHATGIAVSPLNGDIIIASSQNIHVY